MRTTARHTARRAVQVLRHDGVRPLLAKVARTADRHFALPAQQLPVLARDVLDAVPRRPATGPTTDGSLTVDWVMTPPSAGSGGHTTALRLVEHLESRGHRCRLWLYDVHGGDVRDHERVVRAHWPGVRAQVCDARGGSPDGDAVIATSWPTAYVACRPGVTGRGFYFVQDWEPWFYATSSESVLAEATYRLGLHGVTAGPWLAGRLREHGMASDHVDFGCDTARYRCTNPERRRDVVFYARPSAARRGFALGALALQLFAEEHPDSTVHLFGESVRGLAFPAVDHGLLPVEALDELYNRCAAGLSLSLTNVSLTPLEKLASGCLPVVNDAPHNRAALDNPHVRWAALDPRALADALGAVVDDPRQQAHALEAAASVRGLPWSEAGAQLERVLVRELGTRGCP